MGCAVAGRNFLSALVATFFLCVSGAVGQGAEESGIEQGSWAMDGLPAKDYFPLIAGQFERDANLNASASIRDITVVYRHPGMAWPRVRLLFESHSREIEPADNVQASLEYYSSSARTNVSDIESGDADPAFISSTAHSLEGAVGGVRLTGGFFGVEGNWVRLIYVYATPKRSVVIEFNYVRSDEALLMPEFDHLMSQLRWADFIVDF